MKKWYLKFLEHNVGVLIYDEEKDMYSLDISRPDYFKGRLEKCFLNDAMCRNWMESRLTPEYQQGYQLKMKKLGLNPEDPSHRMELFFLTKGCNINDGMWLADHEDDSIELAPFYGL